MFLLRTLKRKKSDAHVQASGRAGSSATGMNATQKAVKSEGTAPAKSQPRGDTPAAKAPKAKGSKTLAHPPKTTDSGRLSRV